MLKSLKGKDVRLVDLKTICGCGGIGRRARLRIWCLVREGSSPSIRICPSTPNGRGAKLKPSLCLGSNPRSDTKGENYE